MEYIGKLYGKLGNKYFDLGRTSEEFDEFEKHFKEQINFKQAAYKLQGDIETLKEQQAEIEDSKMENDIAFLYEMKQRAINAFDKKDVSDKEMLYTMIDDWIHDLRLKRASAKTEA